MHFGRRRGGVVFGPERCPARSSLVIALLLCCCCCCCRCRCRRRCRRRRRRCRCRCRCCCRRRRRCCSARRSRGSAGRRSDYRRCRQDTVSFHNFKSQNLKLSVSNPKSKYVAYLSVLSQISNCQSLGRKNKHDILKTDHI